MSHAAAHELGRQVQLLLMGDAWHGPNLEQLLDGVTASVAAYRPAGSAHAIHDVLAHIDAWHRELLAVVEGRAYRSMPDGEQWPGMKERGDDAWRRLQESVFEHGRRLSEAVERLDANALARPIEDRDYTLLELLHGFNQHTAYHLGQIALLKRLALAA